MPSRQFHRKSRHGCQKCKERKVKCGQEKPICRHCERLGYHCSFTETQASEAIGSQLDAINDPIPGTSAVGDELHIQDLELMHHYSTTTYYTMTDQIERYYIWQHSIPRHALNHPFLMRGLLTLAALHLHDQNPQAAYLDRATFHQAKALEEYHPHLSNITEENSSALFAFSSIIAAIRFAFLRHPEPALSGTAFIGSMSEIFDLLMGSKAVVIEGHQSLLRGDLAPFIKRPDAIEAQDIELSELGKGASASLDALQEVCGGLDLENQPSYLSAIAELRLVFASAHALGNRPGMSMPLAWPVLVGAHFLSLVKQQDHLALAILAHYGAALHCINDVWFAKGLGANLVRAVVQVVDLHWQPYLRWPISWASIDRSAV
ncbi:uncharacterized protein KY384_008554 [Bacidia gigantensis]|uniref:uncharacterized protein n=1 Tax=Bacidia gigantensis TaxID=2732470 RepID=UPI001D048ECC|nr:uncharacterized protein KY384_008554 [Bacidia gigantensis]KAG8527125.1 hypothetical protein KY384_008554 [Bacidia gigantensis]